MLIDWARGEPYDAEQKQKLLKALDMTEEHGGPVFPLPNMRPTTEGEFWSWQASYGPRARIWLGQKQIAYKWATVILYWMGEVNPSFAVGVFRSYPEPDRAIYWRWSACDHDMQVVKSGHCWRDYKCTKCGVEYHEDSSG